MAKTAIRGGYGIFFEHTNGNEGNAESLESAASPTVQTTSVFNRRRTTSIVAHAGRHVQPADRDLDSKQGGMAVRAAMAFGCAA